jgi:hypothetical protein
MTDEKRPTRHRHKSWAEDPRDWDLIDPMTVPTQRKGPISSRDGATVTGENLFSTGSRNSSDKLLKPVALWPLATDR